ncbi:MAG: TIGR00730 family Rossman fold protein [Actinomycetota bacterium]
MQRPGPASSRRRISSTGDPVIDARIRAIAEGLAPGDADLVLETFASALGLAQDEVSRLDRKIVNSALKEMRYAFRVFSQYRDVRKVSIFGSARTEKGEPEYELARDFARRIAEDGWMVVTGAGPGIMEAGNEGAGNARSIGVNILLPFEAKPNPFIAGDPKLINFKYFFVRKLMFIKESDAFVLLPGGFGTMDEAFELLTLIQTGKSDLHPIVLLEPPSGRYWAAFEEFIRVNLVARGYADEVDLQLYRRVERPEEAIREIERFYRVYHSQRYVGNRLILRLTEMPPQEKLDMLSEEFGDILAGPIEPAQTSPQEIRDNDVPDLARIALQFDRTHVGRLRRLVDRLNE